MGNKRKCLSLETKVAIIRQVKEGTKPKQAIAAEHDIPASTLSTILKNSDKILAAWEANREGQRKKMRLSPYDDVDKAVYAWFVETRSTTQNLPLSGPIIRAKAIELADKMGINSFTASTGWFDRFKHRFNIVYKVASGESAAASTEVVASFHRDLPSLLSSYHPRDVYNIDETGLFYRLMPDRTFALRGDECHGSKKYKDRITLLLGCNMDGSDKLRPLAIGRYRTPRCLKGVPVLPVEYDHSANAWMTSTIFTEFLRKFDRRMGAQGRRVLLFMDNCSAHKHSLRLQHTTVHFLPPNTTSVIQPLDQGIIRAFKAHYRRRMVQMLLVRIEAKEAVAISLYDALILAAAAWREVMPQVISNCFRKGGFMTTDDPQPAPTAASPDDADGSPTDDRQFRNVWDSVS